MTNSRADGGGGDGAAGACVGGDVFHGAPPAFAPPAAEAGRFASLAFSLQRASIFLQEKYYDNLNLTKSILYLRHFEHKMTSNFSSR